MAEAPPVTRTKLHRPPLPADLVHRRRLIDALDAHPERPLTLISAAAGYGKSTLVSAWLAGLDCASAWLSLDEADDDPRAFLAHLSAAIEGTVPSSLPRTSALLRAETLPPLRVLAATLADEVDALGAPLVVVLDDMHRVSAMQVHDLLAAILDHPPRGLHLVVASRRDPPLPLARLRGRGQLVEIRADALRLTREEGAAFLASVLGAAIEQHVADGWVDAAEGWITGLRLATLALRPGDRFPENPFAIGQGQRDTARYLLGEVIEQQPPDAVENLLRCAVADRFCADLCDALREPGNADGRRTADGRRFVDWMEGVGLFVVPLDDERRWFRFHHLFLDLLRDEASRRLGDAALGAMRLRASEWFEEQGLIAEAFDLALAAGDVDRAADVLARNARPLLNVDRLDVLERWLRRLPANAVLTRPDLILAMAFARFCRWELEGVRECADRIDALMGGGAPPHEFSGEVALLRGMADVYVDAERSFEQLEIALARIPTTGPQLRLRSGACFYFGRAAFCTGRRELLERRIGEWRRDGEMPALLEARVLLMMATNHHLAAESTGTLAYTARLREFAARSGLDNQRGWADYLDGLVYLLRGELDDAVRLLDAAAERRYFVFPYAGADTLAALTVAHQMTGRPELADATLQSLLDFVDGQGAYLASLASSCATRLALLRGRTPDAAAVDDCAAQAQRMAIPGYFELPSVTLCRALVAAGDPDGLARADATLLALAQRCEGSRNPLQRITVLALRAVACERCGDHAPAIAALEHALARARPAGFVFPFVELGAPMAALLERFRHDHGDDGGFVERIARSLRSMAAATASTDAATASSRGAEAPPPSSERLTGREREVLRMLADGLYQREIAERLFISTETVKTHSKRIYQKLGVRDRRAAVDKGRSLDLIARH